MFNVYAYGGPCGHPYGSQYGDAYGAPYILPYIPKAQTPCLTWWFLKHCF